MKGKILLGMFIILAVVLGTSCKKKVEEPVVEAPKPVVQVEEESPTLNEEMSEVLDKFQNQGTTSYTKEIYPGDLKNGKTGQIAFSKVDTFLSYEQTWGVLKKYLIVFSWQAPSGGSLEVGIHPNWEDITNLDELQKRHDYMLYDLKKVHNPGDKFYVVGPNKIGYLGKFVDKEGNLEYFAYYRDGRELPVWVEP